MEHAFIVTLTVIMWAWLWLVTVLIGAAIGYFLYLVGKETWLAFKRSHDKRKGINRGLGL